MEDNSVFFFRTTIGWF